MTAAVGTSRARTCICAALLLVVVSPPADAASRSSLDAGQKFATRRGFSGEKASCVATIFARNASVGPRGGWQIGATPKDLALYRSDLRRSCGVRS